MKYTIEDLIRREGREPGGGRSLMPLAFALGRYWKEHPAKIKRMWREAWPSALRVIDPVKLKRAAIRKKFDVQPFTFIDMMKRPAPVFSEKDLGFLRRWMCI